MLAFAGVSTDVLASQLDRAAEEAAAADAGAERDREETLAVATTSLAAVGTAWAAFQSATWSGRQTFALAQAAKLRQLSSEARLEGDQQMHLDADLFVAWAGAYAQGHEALAQFLRERFSVRLKPAMDAWLATKPRVSKDAPPHPLAMPEYRVEAHERAAVQGKGADDAVEEGRFYNWISDTYVLFTVVLATIILIASVGPRLHRRHPRRAMIVLSGVALLFALAWLAMRPVAWPGV